jgi:hypothetical protein
MAGINVVGPAGAWLALSAVISSACAGGDAPRKSRGTTWLKGSTSEQLTAVEQQFRGLDVAMVEIGYRFGELYWAGQDRNWDYARYQADKIKLALELSLQRRPKRAASAQPFLTDDLPVVVAAIDAKDAGRYQAALERLRAGCLRCHVAESMPFFTAQFPERRVSVIRPPE